MEAVGGAGVMTIDLLYFFVLRPWGMAHSWGNPRPNAGATTRRR